MVLSADDTALNKTEEDNLCISGVYRKLVSHYSKRKKDGGQCPELQYVKVEEIHFNLIMDDMNNIKK